jgi:hypothetical protein
VGRSSERGGHTNRRLRPETLNRELACLKALFNHAIKGTTDSRPQADVPFKPLNSAGTLIYIHTFSATWLNELRGNGTRFADSGITDGGGIVNFGIPYINVQGLPFSNNIQFGVQQNSTNPAIFAENTYEVRDLVTHTFGSHTIRFGGELRWEQDNDNLSGLNRPVYAMQGLWNFANDAPIYEGINANTVTGGPTLSQLYLRSKDFAVFVQHDWKATATFTLNTGFRFEIYTPISNKTGNISKPVLGPTGSELSGMKLVPTHDLYNTDYGHYGPKVGFAWVPTRFGSNSPGSANFNLCCGQDTSQFAAGQIKYALDTSNSANSFPANPALAVGLNANGFPQEWSAGRTLWRGRHH